MHVGKMLARLNPKNVRFDVGSGGIPDLLTTDIAAALAFVEPGLGRELLCRVWWPDGAVLTESKLIELFEKMQLEEWGRRESAMLDATLAVALHGHRARPTYSAAHAMRWPRMVRGDQDIPRVVEAFIKIRKAVLDELCSAGLCGACAGHGIATKELIGQATCQVCAGSGHLRVSERSRAASVGQSWTSFRDTWAGVYDWTYQACMDQIQRATRQFQAAIGT